MRLTRPLLVIAAVIVMLAAAALMMTGPATLRNPNGDGGDGGNFTHSGIWLNDLQALQVGGRAAMWISLAGRMDEAAGRTLVVDVYVKPPVRHVVLLTGPWAGAGKMDEFGPRIKTALSQTGWAYEVRNLSDLQASADARILVLPSGAWPASLMKDWESVVGPRDIVVYFGVKQNVTLDDAGGLSGDTPVRNELLASGTPSGYIADGQLIAGPGGREVWIVPHTLGEYADLSSLADEMTRGLTNDLSEQRVWRQNITWSAGARTAVVLLPVGFNQEAMARLRLIDSSGRLSMMWDSPLHALAGDIESLASAKQGQATSFQIRLQPSYPQDEHIRYRAMLYGPNQSIAEQIDLGDGTIKSGGAWVGSFTYDKWPQAGDWRIRIEDQFGRLYAQAAVHVIEYRVEMLASSGDTYRFGIFKDGQPLPDMEAQVRRAGGEWSAVPVVNGVLSVTADWKSGEKRIEITADGMQMSYSWEGEFGGAWAVAWKWGVPGIILAGVIYFVLRPRSRPAYRIHVGEMPMSEPKRASMSTGEMIEVMRRAARRSGMVGDDWALRAEDVMECLHRAEAGKKPVMASSESVEDAIEEMAREGQLVRWREWFGTAGRGVGEEEIRLRALGKMTRDRLVEMGTRPREIRAAAGAGGRNIRIVAYTDELGRVWQVHDPRAWRMQWARGRLPDYAVLADSDERKAFSRELARGREEGADRLRIAIKTGRTKLVTVAEMAGR